MAFAFGTSHPSLVDWFNALLREKYSKWCEDFLLYKLESTEEFEQQWHKMIVKYNLKCNKYIKGLHQVRKD